MRFVTACSFVDPVRSRRAQFPAAIFPQIYFGMDSGCPTLSVMLAA